MRSCAGFLSMGLRPFIVHTPLSSQHSKLFIEILQHRSQQENVLTDPFTFPAIRSHSSAPWSARRVRNRSPWCSVNYHCIFLPPHCGLERQHSSFVALSPPILPFTFLLLPRSLLHASYAPELYHPSGLLFVTVVSAFRATSEPPKRALVESTVIVGYVLVLAFRMDVCGTLFPLTQAQSLHVVVHRSQPGAQAHKQCYGCIGVTDVSQ